MKTLFLSLFAFLSLSQQSIATENLAQAEQFLKNQKALFEENKGQVTGADASKVNFVYKEGALSVFLLKTGIAYQFNKTHYPEGYKHLDKFASTEEREQMDALANDIRAETYRMDVSLLGANPNAKVTSEGKSADYIQYYNYNALDVHSYSKITYHEVYPNIDWVIYKTNTQLKYDFVVRPGGDPNQIKLQTSDVEDLTLNQDGSVTLKNRMGTITEQSPISFQNGKEIVTTFNIQNNTISFDLDNYDPTQTLIIDPSLEWATYYGGSGYEEITDVTVDIIGDVYVSGETGSSTGIAANGHQNSYGGNVDAFLVKFNSAGFRQWGTYYGGNSVDYGYSFVVDGSGNIYLTGLTASSTGISFNGHQNTLGGLWDAFLVKFNSSGVRQWGTYYGGSSYDYCTSCNVDGSGNIYMAGTSSSTTGISFNGHQNTYGGGNDDAFLVKFNSAGVRERGTYFGGSGADFARSCALDGSGNVYMAGQTDSPTGIAANGHQNTNGGNNDAFIVKFNVSGVREWGTYYGGSGTDNGYSCALDGFGYVYLAGYTESTTNITANGHQNTFGGGDDDAFLVKFNLSGVREWGTYFGGSLGDYAYSCAIDGSGNIYITGETYSTNNIATTGAYQTSIVGQGDAFLSKFNSSGVRQWGTYYGGIGDDYGYFCAVDGSGNIYLTGQTTSNMGIASNGHQNTYGGGYSDAYLAKFNDAPVITCTNTNEPNESIAAAQVIAVNTDITGQIALSNDKDYLKFTTTVNSDITLSLTNLPANYNLRFYDNSNTQIGISANSGTTSETIVLTNLAPGTYTANIYGVSGAFSSSACYTFKANVSPAATAVCMNTNEPNETRTTAKAIAVNTDITGQIASASDRDFLKYTLTSPSNVVINLTNLPANYNLRVFNASASQIGSSLNTGTANESISFINQAVGTYTIQIISVSGANSNTACYTLRVNTSAATGYVCTNTYEPNETFATSKTIPTGVDILGQIVNPTGKDYLNFTTSNTSNVKIQLSTLPADYDLRIYNSSAVEIGSSQNAGTNDESISLNNLAAGTYTVFIYGYAGAMDTSLCYTLKVTAPGGGGVRLASTDVEDQDLENTSTLNTNMLVFPNPNKGLFVVDVASLTEENANLRILDYTGKVVFEQAFNLISGNSQKEVSLENLASGVYLVQVQGQNWVKQEKIIVE
jgi:hypothetical protein